MCAQQGAQVFTSMVKQELRSFRNATSKIFATGERTMGMGTQSTRLKTLQAQYSVLHFVENHQHQEQGTVSGYRITKQVCEVSVDGKHLSATNKVVLLTTEKEESSRSDEQKSFSDYQRSYA